LPTSQYPELFFDVRYIVGCCRQCNAHGGQVKSANRANRMTISHFERVVEEREAEIEDLRAETSSSPSLAAPSRASSEGGTPHLHLLTRLRQLGGSGA
jgi:hypothetical protein